NPVDSVLQELQYVQHYHEVYYAAEQIRHQRIAQALAAPLNPQCPLTTNDVLLVSGGGKGITAECALTLAQHSGARVALLGRATPEQDSDLATNLQRFQAAQIDFRYLTLDITDAVAVDTTLKSLTADWGPITAVLHGAGTNQPKLLGDLDEAACQRTLAPKVQGLSNLLAAIEPQHLRLLISFGSIIAPLGLAGEADYALANDWLAELTADFQAAHPHCRCLTLDWSVWSEVGMGARLGRVETLAQQGITPITPEVGKALFHQALGAEHWPQRVIISGRWPETATLTLARTELPFLRFLEQQPRVDYPQVELIVDTELSTLTDPYLREHQFEQQNLLPAVMGLEAMAQVAATVLGVAQAPLFETVLFSRPIVVEHTETIRIAALVKDAQTVDVVLRCGQTDFQIDHFRARCRFTAPLDLEVVASLHQRPAALEPQTELYQGGLLFQRGRFQRVQRYHHLEARYCDYELAYDATTSWFGRYLSPTLLLGDPGARDAAIHAIQAGIPHAQLLPLSIERLQLVDTQPCSQHRVSAQERWRQGDLFCYDLTIRDAHTGQVREIWHGLQLKQLSPIQWPQGWPQPLLAPYIERRLQELLATTVQVALEDHLQANSEVAFAKLLGTEAEIVHQANGKPQVVGLEHLSISAAHCQTLTLVVASETKIACDLEQVMAREATIWQGMLGAGLWGLGQMVAQQQHEDLDTTATRLWTLKECLKKAGMALETPVTLHHVADDNWLLFTAGAAMIASYIGKLKSQEPSLAVAILVGVNDATSV
ncbi:MAG: SDR family oxidoreductase, partial [Pseudomonadota bacterium]|nr:SDR family oxidoreductase [Pseudomonadota bacterium]